MNIKVRTYYKQWYSNGNYVILYTGNKWIYIIAEKEYDKPLNKFDKKFKWWTIEEWQRYIKHQHIKVEEISKEDLFLELL